jgi:hypothetical protein
MPKWMSFIFDFLVLLSHILTVTLKEEVTFLFIDEMRQDFSAYRNKPHLPLPPLSEK